MKYICENMNKGFYNPKIESSDGFINSHKFTYFSEEEEEEEEKEEACIISNKMCIRDRIMRVYQWWNVNKLSL